MATSPSQPTPRQQSRPNPSDACMRLVPVTSLCTIAVESPSAGAGDTTMDVAQSTSSLALPKCFLWAGDLAGATGTAKGSRCSCSQASSSVHLLVLQSPNPEEVPGGSHTWRQEWAGSRRGATLGASQHGKTAVSQGGTG